METLFGTSQGLNMEEIDDRNIPIESKILLELISCPTYKTKDLQNSITPYNSLLCFKANLILIQYLFQPIPVGIRDGSWPNFALFLFYFIS